MPATVSYLSRPLPIEGPRLRLRPVVPDDAANFHALYTDPRYNTHLSPVVGRVEAHIQHTEFESF